MIVIANDLKGMKQIDDLKYCTFTRCIYWLDVYEFTRCEYQEN